MALMPEEEQYNRIINAAEYGGLDEMREILQQSPNIDPRQLTLAFITAISHGNAQIGQALLDYADPEVLNANSRDPIYGYAALIHAVRGDWSEKKAETALMLFKNGADPTISSGEEGLNIWTATLQNPGMSQWLKRCVEARESGTLDALSVQHTSSPQAAQDEKNRKLLLAASLGNVEAAKQALGEGAQIDAATETGQTALMFATTLQAYLGITSLALAELLLARGANVNARDNAGRTVLMNAAEMGHPEPLRLLCDTGADPLLEMVDMFGRTQTALTIISCFNIPEPVEILQEATDRALKAKPGNLRDAREKSKDDQTPPPPSPGGA